jgi:hypothetical protein
MRWDASRYAHITHERGVSSKFPSHANRSCGVGQVGVQNNREGDVYFTINTGGVSGVLLSDFSGTCTTQAHAPRETVSLVPTNNSTLIAFRTIHFYQWRPSSAWLVSEDKAVSRLPKARCTILGTCSRRCVTVGNCVIEKPQARKTSG